jgi:hypothetical protein
MWPQRPSLLYFEEEQSSLVRLSTPGLINHCFLCCEILCLHQEPGRNPHLHSASCPHLRWRYDAGFIFFPKDLPTLFPTKIKMNLIQVFFILWLGSSANHIFCVGSLILDNQGDRVSDVTGPDPSFLQDSVKYLDAVILRYLTFPLKKTIQLTMFD